MIAPIEQHNPVKNTPWTVYFLIFINTAIFLTLDQGSNFHNSLKTYGFIPATADFTTAFTSIFMHFNIKHLAFNMFFLYMVGDNVEDVLNKPLFIVSYILTGLFAVFTYFTFNADSVIPLVGASGAISGILAIYVVMFPHTHMQFVIFNVPAKLGVLFWLLLQLGFALAFMNVHAGIAFSAHIGGFALGLVLGFIFKKVLNIIPPVPDTLLIFERTSERGNIWCPHCGHKETSTNFGTYKCINCGTEYIISEAEKEKKSFFNINEEITTPKKEQKKESYSIEHPRTKDLFE